MPPNRKTISAAAMTTNRITSLRELLHSALENVKGSYPCAEREKRFDYVSFNSIKFDLSVGQAVRIINFVCKIVDWILCCYVRTFYLTQNFNVL